MAGSLYAQRDNRIIEHYPEQLDSMYYMKWNAANGTWMVDFVRHYGYEKENFTSLLLLDGSTRDSVWIWYYYYNQQNLKHYELLLKWTNGVAGYSQKKDSKYSSDGRKTEELLSNWKNSGWIMNTNSLFEYSNDKLVREILQTKDKIGNFVNNQYIDYIYTNEVLEEVRTIRVSDGVLLKYTQYFYNELGKLFQAVYYQLKTSSAGNSYEPVSRRTYSYDRFGLTKETLFENWVNQGWELSANYIFFRKIDFAKKVTICHNGRSITVAKEAVPAHLAHGDYLGKCKVELQNPKDERRSLQNEISAFPNPAQNQFTLKLNAQEVGAKYYGIYNLTGKLVKTAQIGSDETLVDITDIPKGIYLIKVFGNQVYEQKIVKQ